MKMTVIAQTPTGSAAAIEEIFKKYAIDMMKKISEYGEAHGEKPLDFSQIPGGWDWVMPESPIEIVDAVSWGWTARDEAIGASGRCVFYVNAPVKEEFKGRTVASLDRDGSKINLDITVE